MIRRLSFGVLVVLGVTLLAEAGSWLALSILDGRPFRPARFAAERRAVAAEAPGAPATGGGEAGREPVADSAKEVVHPYLGFVMNPRRLPMVWSDDQQVSEYGFNDTAPPFHERGPGRAIVAITGGSMARHFGFEGVERLASRLRESPRFAGKEIVFVRLGLGGYKHPQQLLTVAYLLGLGAQFDVVIALDGFNEVALHAAENAMKGVFPAFPRNWALRAAELPDPAARARLGEATYLAEERGRWARRFESTWARRSALANLVWAARERRLARRQRAAEDWLRELPPDRPSYAATGPRTGARDKADALRTLVSIWREGSLQLHRLCRANGIQYLHFLQPNQYVPGSKPLGEAERRVAWLDTHPGRAPVEAGYPLLIAAGAELAALGVRFHDLTRIFEGVTDPIYVDNCCHVNRRGNELIADAMAQAILAADDPSR